MADEAPETVEAESQEPQTGKMGPRLLAIGVLVVSLGLGGAAGYAGVGRFMTAKKTEDVKKTEEKKVEPAALFSIENLVVNPAGSNGARFLIVTVAIQPSRAEDQEALKRLEPQLRDAVGHLLGEMTVDQVSDIARRDSVKVRIEKAVETVLGKKIADVYLPQFVLQ